MLRRANALVATQMLTFLFVGTEGSTAMSQRLGAAYPGVLAGYRRLIRASDDADRPPPWKRRVTEDLDGGFGIQMFGHVASRHAVHGGEHDRRLRAGRPQEQRRRPGEAL